MQDRIIMTKEKNWKEKIKVYALKNAVEHEGKAQEGSVISALFHEGLKREDVKDVIKIVKEEVGKINKLTVQQQKKEFEKREDEVSHRAEREGLPELPDAEKGVVMRFAPNPSGPLHIGHAISVMPSYLYFKRYGGKFYIRLEDTDPETAFKDSYKSFKEEFDWLCPGVTAYIIQSDRMKWYYEYAEKLIKKNAAYVCTCSHEKFKKLKDKQQACPCRAISIEENLERWNKMLDKKGYKEGGAVLRFKSDLQLENPALREFPLARIKLKAHPRQGKKYRVWPMMHLCVAVDDIEYKMTHIIRAKEHRDNAERQKMIYKVLGLEKQYPWTFFLGRYKFTDLVLSKRKLLAGVKAGDFTGFDDPNLPTLASLRKRGYLPEAFAKMAEDRGLSEVDKVLSKEDFFQLLDNYQKEAISEAGKK